ncbi:unnamed protein product [Amoebophrya sp. A120]|nr:unnamed protein product [Amoebophrya sp. A120]|eukprot:GSA120T00023631001.1
MPEPEGDAPEGERRPIGNLRGGRGRKRGGRGRKDRGRNNDHDDHPGDGPGHQQTRGVFAPAAASFVDKRAYGLFNPLRPDGAPSSEQNKNTMNEDQTAERVEALLEQDKIPELRGGRGSGRAPCAANGTAGDVEGFSAEDRQSVDDLFFSSSRDGQREKQPRPPNLKRSRGDSFESKTTRDDTFTASSNAGNLWGMPMRRGRAPAASRRDERDPMSASGTTSGTTDRRALALFAGIKSGGNRLINEDLMLTKNKTNANPNNRNDLNSRRRDRGGRRAARAGGPPLSSSGVVSGRADRNGEPGVFPGGGMNKDRRALDLLAPLGGGGGGANRSKSSTNAAKNKQNKRQREHLEAAPREDTGMVFSALTGGGGNNSTSNATKRMRACSRAKRSCSRTRRCSRERAACSRERAACSRQRAACSRQRAACSRACSRQRACSRSRNTCSRSRNNIKRPPPPLAPAVVSENARISSRNMKRTKTTAPGTTTTSTSCSAENKTAYSLFSAVAADHARNINSATKSTLLNLDDFEFHQPTGFPAPDKDLLVDNSLAHKFPLDVGVRSTSNHKFPLDVTAGGGGGGAPASSSTESSAVNPGDLMELELLLSGGTRNNVNNMVNYDEQNHVNHSVMIPPPVEQVVLWPNGDRTGFSVPSFVEK